MINAKTRFTTGNYRDPEKAPASERESAQTVRLWIEKATAGTANKSVPLVPLTGRHAVTKEEYQEFRSALRHASYPCPIGLILNERCYMWVEDERALPETLEHAKAVMYCVDLTRMYRLPL